MSDFVQQNGTICEFSTSDSWVILSPIELSIKQKIEAAGIPLKHWNINIYRGILTGCNEAFIISEDKKNEILSNCETNEERQRTVELIRPILRGRDIKRYGYNWDGLYLINTHNGVKDKYPRIDIEDYPAIKNHLDKYWTQLSKRADKGDTPYNLRNCAYMEDFYLPKISWARLMRITKSDVDSFPRFSLIPEGMMVLDSLCFFSGREIELLCQILNSEFATYYFFQNIVVLDNGGFQMRQQYIEETPIPNISSFSDRSIYAAFGFTSDEITFIRQFIKQKKEEIINSNH